MWRGCAIIAYGASSFFIYALTSCYYGSVETWGWTKCKALHWQMQSFALTDAKLCVGRCNALREIGNVGTEIVSPILDK